MMNSQRKHSSLSEILWRWMCTGALTVICLSLAGCASETERDKKNFESDRAAVTEVRRIQAGLARAPNLPQSDLDLLKSLHAKYPAAAEVRQTLQNALQARQDWDALEKLLTEKPEAERTPQESVYLSKIYIKLGRYKDASRITGPMAEAAPNDLELNSLAGHAWYYEGQYDNAARAFDRVWDAIVASKQVDEMMMRGMIYFFKGDKDRALEILKKTVEINPDFLAGNNALSRVYAAKGDQQQAEYYRAQAEKAHARQTADEARRMRLTSRARDLESAFAAGRYDESVRIALEMIQSADEAQKPALYEYLGQAYKASGKQAEAQAAFQEAARLRQQTKS
jgi:tetratricopeptide (TPR) repeat protein